MDAGYDANEEEHQLRTVRCVTGWAHACTCRFRWVPMVPVGSITFLVFLTLLLHNCCDQLSASDCSLSLWDKGRVRDRRRGCGNAATCEGMKVKRVEKLRRLSGRYLGT